MKCEDYELLQHALLDQELDPAGERELSRHEEGCSACAAKIRELMVLKQTIKIQASRHILPRDLEGQIARIVKNAPSSRSERYQHLKWGGAGGAFALVVCLSFLFLMRPSEEYLLEQQLITSHIRSLQEGHLVDVLSTDQHTVKPWFSGRLDLSPPVIDLSANGFTLVGGRLDYIAHHTAAVIVYRSNAHVINLFVWPSDRPQIDFKLPLSRQGYSIRRWQDQDLEFWSVSDVNSAKLSEFETLYRASIPKSK